MLAHLAHPTRYSKLHFEFELAVFHKAIKPYIPYMAISRSVLFQLA